MRFYTSPEEKQQRKAAAAARSRKANKKLPFKPEPYSQGPHAQAAHTAGGKLIGVPLNREKFNAGLAAHAPGCASPIYPYGPEAGAVKCGAKLNGKTLFCDYCKPPSTLENRAITVVNSLLEAPAQRYRIRIGKQYWFEYHCYEGHDSADAELWYHSHQKCRVLAQDAPGAGRTENERFYNGQPAAYEIEFEDRYRHVAVEDELLESKAEFTRPDPPSVKTKIK